jgi:hypothetical protein
LLFGPVGVIRGDLAADHPPGEEVHVVDDAKPLSGGLLAIDVGHGVIHHFNLAGVNGHANVRGARTLLSRFLSSAFVQRFSGPLHELLESVPIGVGERPEGIRDTERSANPCRRANSWREIPEFDRNLAWFVPHVSSMPLGAFTLYASAR